MNAGVTFKSRGIHSRSNIKQNQIARLSKLKAEPQVVKSHADARGRKPYAAAARGCSLR
jgi:hypothetical protein